MLMTVFPADLGLKGTSRCKKANGSGRAANVLTESNDKDIALYFVFIQSPYSIAKFERVVRDRMSRFPNVRAVAVADRTADEWRVRRYLEREGEEIGTQLGEALTAKFPLLSEDGAIVNVPNNLVEDTRPASGMSVDKTEFDNRAKTFAPLKSAGYETLREFQEYAESQGLIISASVAADAVAACLSSQFVLFAGPSGTGKSRLAQCLAEFFTSEDSFHALDGRRQLLGPEDVAGYYSNIGKRFALGSDTLGLIDLHESATRPAADVRVPFLIVEEANLSAIEGYLAPLIHGLADRRPRHLLGHFTPA